VLSIVVLGAAFQLLAQTALARSLPKSEVGVIALILGALPLLSTLSLFGQDAATVRFLSRPGGLAFDARSHVKRVLLIVLPLGAVAGAAGAAYYGLAGAAAAAIVVLVVSQNALLVATSVPRARHEYERAMTGRWLPLVTIGIVYAVLFASGSLTYGAALATMILSFGGAAVLYTLWQLRADEPGSERVPAGVMREGLFLFGITVSFSVMVSVDKMVIGKMLPYADLAVYAVVFSIMKAFDFVFYSLAYVLMPRVNIWERVNLRRLNTGIAGVAVVLTAGYLLFGDDVVRFLFGGRYDAGIVLIGPFVLAGILKLFYSVPSSVIGGRLPRKALKGFLWFSLGAIVLNVALDIVFISLWGLVGAAIATAIAWAFRLIGGYVIIAINREHLGAPNADVDAP
jgi:O-antigen/teichoic acid export membrane protein